MLWFFTSLIEEKCSVTKASIHDFSGSFLQLEEITQDVSVSQTSQAADYMEDVAWKYILFCVFIYVIM